jgi:hypothetical protein
MHCLKTKFVAIVCLVFVNTSISHALTSTEVQCGSLQSSYGPFDYRTASSDKKQLVEGVHFTSDVERLVRGNASGADPLGDITYTLRVFPNHPRALRSLMEYGFRKKNDSPAGSRLPIWCYFDRAVRFQPDDAQVKMLYAIYLSRKGKPREAAIQLEEAQPFVGDSANLHYNMGLVYLDVGDFEKSLYHAHQAYSLGFPLEGLKNRLKRSGKWREAVPAPKPVEPPTVSPNVPASMELATPPQE